MPKIAEVSARQGRKIEEAVEEIPFCNNEQSFIMHSIMIN